MNLDNAWFIASGAKKQLRGSRKRKDPRRFDHLPFEPWKSELPSLRDSSVPSTKDISPLNLDSQFKKTMSRPMVVETQNIAVGKETAGICDIPRNIKIIGIPSINPVFAAERVKRPPRLFLMNYKKFSDSRKLYHPIKWVIGDCIGQTAIISPQFLAPINGPVNAPTFMTNDGLQTSVTKGAAVVNTVVKVRGLGINQYSDYCYPVLPNLFSYNSNNATSGCSLGLRDLFSANPFNVFSGTNETPAQMTMMDLGQNAGTVAQQSVYNVSAGGGGQEYGNGAPFSANHLFLKHSCETRIHNNTTLQTNFEVYYLQSKRSCSTSPLGDYQSSVTHETVTTSAAGNTPIVSGRLAKACYDFGLHPTNYLAFNEKWNVFDKKTFALGAGSTMSLHVDLPWQMVAENRLFGDPDGITPNIGTYWIWIRASTRPCYDPADNLFGSPEAEYLIQHYEKFQTMPSKMPDGGKIDMTSDNRTNVAGTQFNQFVASESVASIVANG